MMDNTLQVRLLFITLIPSLMSGFLGGFYYGKDQGAIEAIRNVNKTVYNIQLHANASKESITIPNNFNQSIGAIQKGINDLTTLPKDLERLISQEFEKNQQQFLLASRTQTHTCAAPEPSGGLQNNIITLASTLISLTFSALIFKCCGNTGASKDAALQNLLLRLSEKLDREEELRKLLEKYQTNTNQNIGQSRALDVVTDQTNNQIQANKKQSPKKTGKIKLLYSFSSDCGPIKEEISSHLRKALEQSPRYQLTHVKDATKLGESGDLLLQFEMVDDRIRLVEAKVEYAKTLKSKTHNNSVWVFICFKPTNNEEGTRITNSVKDFPSGYTTADGEYVPTYLTFEYYVKSTERDKQGNFKHVLADADLFEQKIVQFVQQAKA